MTVIVNNGFIPQTHEYPYSGYKSGSIDCEPPQLTLENAVLEAQIDAFGLSLTQLEDYGKRIREKSKAKTELNQVLQAAINERTQKAMSSNGWSTLLKVASSLGALLSIAVGAVAISTGAATPIGIAMVTAGGLTLSLQVASEFDLMNKVANYLSRGDEGLKNKIEWHLNFWTSISSLILSATTIGVGGANIVGQLLGRSGQILQSGLLITNATFALGKGVTEKYRLDSEAKVKELEIKDSVMTREIEHIRKMLVEVTERRKAELVAVEELIKATDEASTKIIHALKSK